MKTVRRILGDIVGCLVLAGLAALAVSVTSNSDTLEQRENFFVFVYLALLCGGYMSWVKFEKEEKQPRWLLQALVSVGAGAIFFIPDVLIGMYQSPSLPILSAAASTGLMFMITLMVCPGYTFIALAGWARSMVLRLGVKCPQGSN